MSVRRKIQIVSDESGTDQRIQAVCFIAGSLDAMQALEEGCKRACCNAGTSEIKFKDIDDQRKNNAAKSALETFLNSADCRAMVLTWNLHDRRHQIRGRDDQANFHRMIFHGLRSVADWFGDCDFEWIHDKNSALEQEELSGFLNNTRGYRSLRDMSRNLFRESRHRITFKSCQQIDSKEKYLIGLADLLAGAVRFSVEKGNDCVTALNHNPDQAPLFEEPVVQHVDASRAEKAKVAMVVHIKRECDRLKLGVSLKTHKRLTTFNNRRKLWIWHYEPQGDYDKSPVKDSLRKGNQ